MDRYNEVGEHGRAFDTPLGRVGFLICNDRWNADLARLPVLDGADLILIPSYGAVSHSRTREHELCTMRVQLI